MKLKIFKKKNPLKNLKRLTALSVVFAITFIMAVFSTSMMVPTEIVFTAEDFTTLTDEETLILFGSSLAEQIAAAKRNKGYTDEEIYELFGDSIAASENISFEDVFSSDYIQNSINVSTVSQ